MHSSRRAPVQPRGAGCAEDTGAGRLTVFLNSVFPCLSETFVYDQYDVLRRAGLDMAVVSNHRPAPDQVHPRMRAAQSQVYYLCEAPVREILAAHLHVLWRYPLRYLASLARLFTVQERLATSLAQLSGAALVLRRFRRATGLRLHAHFTYGAAAVALWAHRLSGRPYSLTLHGSDLIHDNPPDLAAKLAAAEALVSISRFNVEFVRRHFPRVPAGRIMVLPLGVPPLAAPPRPVPRGGGPVRILSVGRLSEQKAQQHLIDACAVLARKGISFRCDIVGEGPQRPLLEERIRAHGLGDRVRLPGAKFHDEVLELYGGADVFVLCSIAEGMPVVLMEAMRAGVPVIATAIGAVPELVDDGGLIVAPADPAALAAAIAQIADGGPDIAARVARAREIIAARYNLEANAVRFKQFLER